MMSLRQASVALLVLAAGMVILGAGGFSAMEADRPVSVTVVDDGAYLGVDAKPVGDGEKEDKIQVNISNKVSEPIEITQIEANSVSHYSYKSAIIESGEKKKFKLSGEVDELTVHAEADSISVSVTTGV